VIPPEVIERVRDAADLVQLIGEHVELKRTGSDWRGPCPFHGGTNRNFSVVPRKQMYHCFVCHESGDIFTFYQKRFGLDWPSAVREIAGKVGVVVPEDSRESGPDPNEPLYSALGVAAEWFARRLRESPDAAAAREYLAGRGIEESVRDEFGLGYAPVGREEFLRSMHALGLEDEVLLDAGLALRRDDGSIAPRFWGRLLFPIADVRSRVVGFGGRILGDGEPKYLNSPESAVFHKGTLLYLLDRARGPIRQAEHAVLVEGYVDAIRLHAAGIATAVAPLGTSLTGEQAKVLRRYTKTVILSYDADLPGLKSTFRAGDELLRHGFSVQVITLPAGEDPDTLVREHGAAAFNELVSQAVDVFERKIQILERHASFATLEGRREALDKLLATVRAAADPVTRDLYIARAAEKTGVSKQVIAQEAVRADRRMSGWPDKKANEEETRSSANPLIRLSEIPVERILARLVVSAPEVWLPRLRSELTAEAFEHPHYREIVAALLAGAPLPPSPELAGLCEELASPYGADFNAEAEFYGAVRAIRQRPLADRLERIDEVGPLAADDEKDRMLREKLAAREQGETGWRRKALKAEREIE